MVEPLITFYSPVAPPLKGEPKVGDIVENFNTLAKIVGIHDTTGDFILEAYGLDKFPGRWCAPAANLILVEAR